jgi:hypothetical protein
MDSDAGPVVVDPGGPYAEPAHAWVENEDGSIARALAAFVTEDGALLRLADDTPLEADAQVLVRLSLEASAPTLGLSGRVLWARTREEPDGCELTWLPGPERERLASLLEDRS